ncbi:MAG: hypothetical protein ABSF33_06880 [Acidimicrobiales bacterium]
MSIGAALVLLVGGVTMFGSASVASASARTTVTSLKAKPSSLTWAGGTVTLHARVTNATGCVFSVTPTIKGLPTKKSCSNGIVDEKVTVPRNTRSKAMTYLFSLLVTGSRFKATTLTFVVGARSS